jgi:membrane associated rhomboid family serine protease
MDFSAYPITVMLIVLNAIISIIGFTNETFLNKFIGWPYYEKHNKEYYRLLSSGFLHADWMHLIFNMFTLFSFGRLVEPTYAAAGLGGSVGYVALYILGLLFANIPDYVKRNNNDAYRSLGASGAVSAVVFAAIVFYPWSKIYIYGIGISAALYAVLYVVYCIYMSKQNSGNINHGAHLWGSIFGLVFTFALIGILNPALFPRVIEEIQKFNFLGN